MFVIVIVPGQCAARRLSPAPERQLPSEVSDMLASGGVVDPDVDSGRAMLAFVVFKIG